MNYFIVYAQPEPNSLNGLLRDRAVAALHEAGHEVRVSDLYAMGWKAAADGADFPARDPDLPLRYGEASGEAFRDGAQSPNIAQEQQNLLWADFVVFQFPLWWFGMPAILKGWIDRVYAKGFAYGVGRHEGTQWGLRYGEGNLAGRRAMVATTAGGRAPHYGPRGVNGLIDDILWPIHHGVFFYPGMQVMPPTVFYQVGHSDPSAVEEMVLHYVDRLLKMGVDDPIPFRNQNQGDYDQNQVLLEEHAVGSSGLLVHQREPRYVANTLVAGPDGFRPTHFAPDSRETVGSGDEPDLAARSRS